ncbi:hypothetical protein N9762_01025 [Gammaproteobacteria bacterium]|jgi:hypothetical protein|nr:hypothetical protein [Gammaproteobacteria bacterium]
MTSVLVLSSLTKIREIGDNRVLDYRPDLPDDPLQPSIPIPEPPLHWFRVDLAKSQALTDDVTQEAGHE